jgi:hypothetical protein
MQPNFKLISSETKPLTPELAGRFKAMLPSPTERVFDPARAKMLHEKAEAGQLIAFNWAIAKVGDKEYRVNGQHSSAVLAELNGQFPLGLKVHMDTYAVSNTDGLALLFRQFDARKSGRTPTDVSGAYQGLYTDLAGVPRGAAKLAVEGVAWYDKNVEGLPAPKGDDVYTLFGKTGLHSFIRWVGEDILHHQDARRSGGAVARTISEHPPCPEIGGKVAEQEAKASRDRPELAFKRSCSGSKREAAARVA